ncbi:MAG: hypothetical protein V7724_00975 [Sediminicola sp.]
METRSPKSLCSSCIHAPYCALTCKKGSVHACSEYWHHKDMLQQPLERYFKTFRVPEV